MVKKATGHYLNLSIKFKLILMLYIAILPFLLFIIGYLNHTMRQSTEKALQTAYLEMAGQINASVNFVLKDTEDISTYLYINDYLYSNNSLENSLKNRSSEIAEQAGNAYLMALLASKSHLSTIALYGNNWGSPYYIISDTSVLSSDFSQITASETYRKADEARGVPVWERHDSGGNDLFTLNKSPKIVMTRVIRDFFMGENLGYLVLGINSSYFENICRTAITGADEGLMVCKGGEALVEMGNIMPEIRETVLNGQIREALGKNKSGIVSYQEHYIFYSKTDDRLAEIFYMVPDSFFVDNLRHSFTVSILLVIGVVLLLFPISILFSNAMVRPLNLLKDSMKKFKKGDFNQQVAYHSNDEIGEVTKGYNDMVRNIKELIDTTYILKLNERESELNALQAQINPHFLYNTLDSIYWKSLEDGNGEVADMVYSLARIFRLSLNRGQGLTTVEKEIELVENYLIIQKKRYNEQLDYVLEVDEEASQCIVPKLLLQPFVENAIVHGIEENEANGFVYVNAGKKDGYIFFTITDTGKGMSSGQIKKITQPQPNGADTSKTPGGYAISNVYERLRLRYKDDFELKIESRENQGTKVSIRIPCHNFM